MSSNLIQFASLFDAVGSKINFNSDKMEAEVIEYPRGKRDLVNDALQDIDHFLDTKIYSDGVAILAIASHIDGEDNPLKETTRTAILENLGLVKSGRYVSQVLGLIKANKSWHTSEKAHECTYFGDLCTSRGTVEVDGKPGRKSTRIPTDYHTTKSNGIINREQLVTPSLDALFKAIPDTNLISVRNKDKNIIRLDKIDELDSEELAHILSKIKEAEAKKNVAN